MTCTLYSRRESNKRCVRGFGRRCLCTRCEERARTCRCSFWWPHRQSLGASGQSRRRTRCSESRRDGVKTFWAESYASSGLKMFVIRNRIIKKCNFWEASGSRANQCSGEHVAIDHVGTFLQMTLTKNSLMLLKFCKLIASSKYWPYRKYWKTSLDDRIQHRRCLLE